MPVECRKDQGSPPLRICRIYIHSHSQERLHILFIAFISSLTQQIFGSRVCLSHGCLRAFLLHRICLLIPFLACPAIAGMGPQ